MSTPIHLVCPHCDAINRVVLKRIIQQPARCGHCHQSLFTGQPVELNDERFERHLIRNQLPLVVDFWAPWCAPCRAMAPMFAQAAQQLEPWVRLIKVNTETTPLLAQRWNVRSIPTLVIIRDGREQCRISGALELPALLQWIKTTIN